MKRLLKGCRVSGCLRRSTSCELCDAHLQEELDQEFDVKLVNSVLMKPFVDGFFIEHTFLLNEWESLHKQWLRILDSFEVAVDQNWVRELEEKEQLCKIIGFLIIKSVRAHREAQQFHSTYRRESIKLWNTLQRY